MIRIKSKYRCPDKGVHPGKHLGCLLIFGVALLVAAPFSFGEPVALETARIVARNKIDHHVALYGSWNGSTSPSPDQGRAIHFQDEAVAYLFSVDPGGYVLVSLDDAFSPVPLYSDHSTFDPQRADNPNSLESWIMPDLSARLTVLQRFRQTRAAGFRSGFQNAGVERRIKKAWNTFRDSDTVFASRVLIRSMQKNASDGASARAAAPVGPLLSTAWGQHSPYNLDTPSGIACTHTLTGCVGTAWSQLMKYHAWPDAGSGSHAYQWNGQTLSVDFSAVTYDWAHMPDTLDNTSSQAEINAVAQLMYHVGVAAEMDFGCTSSGSTAWAHDVLDTYFNYKAMYFIIRANYSAADWFNLFKTEINALRPVILSIFSPDGGHEVVVDGYQEDADANSTDMVHLNFGWNGDDDGYYDVTDDVDFDAGGYDWSVTQQYIVTGIQPNYDERPVVSAGNDQTVDEGDAVHLTGTITNPAAGSNTYEWMQVSVADGDQNVSISRSTSSAATFAAPEVGSDTDLVFLFKVTDANRSVGFDKVTVTVRDTTSSTDHSSDSGSSSGGCFITYLF